MEGDKEERVRKTASQILGYEYYRRLTYVLLYGGTPEDVPDDYVPEKRAHGHLVRQWLQSSGEDDGLG